MYLSCSVNLLLWSFLVACLLVRTTRGGDVKPQKETQLPNYTIYHNVSHLQVSLLALTNRAPHYIRLISSFRSREGRPQLLLRITNFTRSQSGTSLHSSGDRVKARILLSYGEHAREFFPVESLIFLLHNLIDGLEPGALKAAKELSRAVLSNIDLFVVAMINPDGRCYIERTGNYCWRGTSAGVDLNRNFDWSFGKVGSSADATDEEYRGPRAFSEPECIILLNLTATYRFDAFVSLHSGIRQIYVPFADSVSKRSQRKPANVDAMMDVASKMSRATSKSFTYNIAYRLNDYLADGTIFDYMAGVRKIPFSFAIELWGEERKYVSCFDLFNPISEKLQAEVIEVNPIYKVLFLYLIKWKQAQTIVVQDSQEDHPLSPTFRRLLLLCGLPLTACLAVRCKRSLLPWLRRRRCVTRLNSLGSMFRSAKA